LVFGGREDEGQGDVHPRQELRVGGGVPGPEASRVRSILAFDGVGEDGVLSQWCHSGATVGLQWY
jgi:hypothetical protein